MGWLTRKLDTLMAAAFAGTAGAVVSQLQEFIQQYLQRIGGHLDEAQRNYQTVLESERYREMAQQTRDILINDALGRVQEIQASHDAIANAGFMAKPFVFLTHMDRIIATRTLENFTPALPVDVESLIYAAIGLVVGFVIYELLKLPFALMFRGKSKDRTART